MPIYEYTCNVCQSGRRFSVLVGVVANAPAPACPKCGGNDIQKVVSRFTRLRSDDEAIDALAEQADSMDMDDPKAVRRLVREMASEMGEEGASDELEALMEEEIASGTTENIGDDL
jgi:putative FmdB family regulatory protein